MVSWRVGGNKWTSVLMHIGANTWILIFSEYAQTLVEKAGAGSLLMIYGVFAAAMIGGYQYFCTPGRKNVATGLSDPMWIMNICLLMDQAE